MLRAPGMMLTQAASRASTRRRAICSASCGEAHVQNTTILSVIIEIARTKLATRCYHDFPGRFMRLSLKKVGFALALLLTVSYAFFTLRGPQGIPGLTQKRKQIQEM